MPAPRVPRARAGRRPGPLLLLAGLLALAACSRAPERPNVLFVLLDDLRWDMLGSYGNRHVRTPRLDALAAEGLSLEAFYVAAPVCVASRIAFHSGRYLIEEGVRRRPRAWIEESTPTVGELFRQAGYRTGFIGKAHASHQPWQLGFEQVPLYHPAFRVGLRYEGMRWLRHRPGAEPEAVALPADPTSGLMDAAIAWIGAEPERPWFLWLSTTAPHFPYVADDRHPYPVEALRAPPGHSLDPAFEPSPLWSRYHSQVSSLDRELGRLLDALDRLALRQDTLVIVTSDNGLLLGSHGIETKGVWFEEAVRQPWIARWPGVIAPGTRSAELVSSVDFVPTMLDVLGREPPGAYEGRSQLGLLRGGASPRRFVYSLGLANDADEEEGPWLMVRDRDRKLVRFERTGDQRLYELAADPHEQSPRLEVADSEPLVSVLDAWLERWEGERHRLMRRLQRPAPGAPRAGGGARP